VALPFPCGISALLDPDDEPYLRILVACAVLRGRLGLPALSVAELRALFDDDALPVPTQSNVIAFPLRRGFPNAPGLGLPSPDDEPL
jgi:hypothetical protein